MANGDKKISELDLFTTLATTAQIAAVNNGSTVRVAVDSVLNDTNNRFWLNDAGTLAYDTFGNSFGRFHVFSGNTWVSGANKWLECPNFRANGSGYVFQLIGGASSNAVYGSTTSCIVGGSTNITVGDSQFLGGGQNNTISGDPWSVICGGTTNFCSGGGSFIGGGGNNFTSPDAYIFLGGGFQNYADGAGATIVGGINGSLRQSDYSFIGAGESNTVDGGSRNVIAGGKSNTNSGVYSFIGGGHTNRTSTASYTVVAGGYQNTIHGAGSDRCVIGGGLSNDIYSSSDSAILGGSSNEVYGGSYDFIAGGQTNITSGNYNSNLGGKSNFSNSDYNLTWGTQSFAVHAGATVLSDQRTIAVGNKYSQATNSFNLYYDGGAYLSGTPLYVLGAETYASGKFAIGMKNVPASSTAAGRAGEITFNTNTGFFCVDTNSWKTIDLDTFGSSSNVSNTYSFVYGGNAANIPFAADDTWQDIQYSPGTFLLVIPATAGTANYLLDATLKYKGSTSSTDVWGFRFYAAGEGAVADSTITRVSYGAQEVETHLKAIYSTSATKNISLQMTSEFGNANGLLAMTGAQMSYIRLT